MRACLAIVAFVAALSFAAAARATEPVPVASVAAGATAPPAEPTPGVTGHGTVRRPVVLGLIAALFLMCGAIVGATDKHHGDKPKSRR